jgi:hypothetical protein
MKRLLEVQPDGIVEFFHFDDVTGEIAIQRLQDVEPVLDANKRAQTAGDGFSPSRELREIAEIPLGVAELWRSVLGVDVMNRDHWPRVKQLLRDRDWKWLRTSSGSI